MSNVFDVPAGPRDIMSSHIFQIAAEVAMDLMPIEDIKRLYGFDDAAWDRLVANPKFDAQLQSSIIAWNSAKNAEQRIRFKAQASIEMSMLRLHSDIHDTNIALSSRMEAFKAMMKLAGMDKPEPVNSGIGQGWSLVINLGGGEQVKVTQAPTAPTVEGAPA